jgi:hypothetical protein
MVESLLMVAKPGGGALADVLILGRRPGVSLEYQGLCVDDNDVVGDVGDWVGVSSSSTP